MKNIISYESVDGWLELISEELKLKEIGLVVGLTGNGVFPALIVSNLIDQPLSFLKKENGNLFFLHSQEVKNIFNITRQGKKVLLCFDSITEENKEDIKRAQHFLVELGAAYQTLAINYDENLNMFINYFLPFDAENEFIWNKNYKNKDKNSFEIVDSFSLDMAPTLNNSII